MPWLAASQPPPAPPPWTPAADAKDLKSVLFNWTWHMGMLRGAEEHELVVYPSPDAGLMPERGHCEVYELEDITTQIRH